MLPRLRRRLKDGGLLQRLAALIRLAPPVSWASLRARTPEHTPAIGEERLRVAVLTGCVQRIAFGHVNEATIRVLSAEGCRVMAPAGQGCCGALALHAGHADSARAFARDAIDAFDRANVDRIVVNAAGCGSAMKDTVSCSPMIRNGSSRARAFSAKVRDVCEVLVELGQPRAPRHPLKARVAYHDACHLAHGQGVRSAAAATVAGHPRPGADGPGGVGYLLRQRGYLQPGAAADRGAARKTEGDETWRRLHPDVIATGNPGCTLQIAAAAREFGWRWSVLHPVELLDASIRGIDPSIR